MSARVALSVNAWAPADPADVHRLVADSSTWPRWTPISSSHLERVGDEGGESVGAIRVFKVGVGKSREQIVEVRPDAGISYVVLSGLPTRNHRADVELLARDGGTAIVWREAFDPTVPVTGPLLRLFLRYFIGRCAKGLVKESAAVARRSGGPPT